MKRNITAPDWREGEPFIEWCRRITSEAFKVSEMHGQMNALEFLIRSKLTEGGMK